MKTYEVGRITINGERFRVEADGTVRTSGDWWWPSHPYARRIRRALAQRRHDRAVLRQIRSLASPRA